MKRTHLLNVYMTEGEGQELERLSRRTGVSQSTLAREALRLFLFRVEQLADRPLSDLFEEIAAARGETAAARQAAPSQAGPSCACGAVVFGYCRYSQKNPCVCRCHAAHAASEVDP